MPIMLMVAAAALAGQALPAMDVEAVPGKGYALTVDPFPLAGADPIQARMIALARETCGARTLRWGKYTYDTRFGADDRQGQELAVNYRQLFACVDPARDAFQPAPADWKAGSADNSEALAFAARYMAAFDRVDGTTGAKMMDPLLEIDAATWSGQPRAITAIAGSGSRTFHGPSWLLNPGSAPHPGIYASFTFRGDYSGLAAQCGSLLLYRRGPNDYQVARQLIRAVDKADVAAGKVSQADAEASCEGY